MPIEIRQHQPGKDTADFIRAATVVFEGDSSFVAPLAMDIEARLNSKKNPFFQHAEVALFTAWRQGKLVGRCSAQIDREHIRRYRDDVGFFGYFDTLEDQEVADALLRRAEAWLKERGMKTIRGPLSFCINEEVGVQVEGFDTPPFLMMPHSRPYQAGLIEAAGFAQAMDFFSWKFEVGAELKPRVERAHQAMMSLPGVKIRNLSRLKMKRDVDILLDIFNDAWSDNWGYVPATPQEAKKMGEDLMLIIDPELAFIVELEGKPIAMCVALPNLNEVIADMQGKSSPLNMLKLLWRLKLKRPKTGRLWMLGIRKKLRGIKRYGCLSVGMYGEIAKRAQKRNMQWGELGWTLEDNHAINVAIKAVGAKKYKTYRVFEKPIS